MAGDTNDDGVAGIKMFVLIQDDQGGGDAPLVYGPYETEAEALDAARKIATSCVELWNAEAGRARYSLEDPNTPAGDDFVPVYDTLEDETTRWWYVREMSHQP